MDTSEQKERERLYNKKYYIVNRKKILKKKSEARENNREILNARTRKWRAENKDELAKYASKYRATNKGNKTDAQKTKEKEYQRVYREENKDKLVDYRNRPDNIIKNKCRDKTRNLIKFGKIKKEPCESCKSNVDVQAHHEDYGDPWNVKFLCRDCHTKLHLKDFS